MAYMLDPVVFSLLPLTRGRQRWTNRLAPLQRLRRTWYLITVAAQQCVARKSSEQEKKKPEPGRRQGIEKGGTPTRSTGSAGKSRALLGKQAVLTSCADATTFHWFCEYAHDVRRGWPMLVSSGMTREPRELRIHFFAVWVGHFWAWIFGSIP